MGLKKTECGECQGYGYDLFQVDRTPGLSIQRNDACDCVATRLGLMRRCYDEDAAALFVYDLEHGDKRATQFAVKIISGFFDCNLNLKD